MKGLPASGKSTLARKILKDDGNAVRVNKDELRQMLHDNKFSGLNEKLTNSIEMAIADTALLNKKNVIIDDTNLNPGTLQHWIDFARQNKAKHEVIDLTYLDVIECVNRDMDRRSNGLRGTGSTVIYKMAMQYLDYMKDDNVIICDIDGTIADISHRLHFVKQEPKDWKNFLTGFEKDEMRWDIVGEVREMAKRHNARIIFVSGRGEETRGETEHWLNKHMIREGIEYSMLLMRNAKDHRPDTEVKAEIYDKYLKNLNILAVYDDRPSVIRMWEGKGLHVVDVGSGKEF